MTGFAEGFASGYGLMDATLKNKRDEEFKQKVLDAENAKTESTSEIENKKLGLTSALNNAQITHYQNYDSNAKTHAENEAIKAKNEGLRAVNEGNRVATQDKLATAQINNQARDDALRGKQEDRLSKIADQENKIKDLEYNKAVREQQMVAAQQQLGAYRNADGSINIPTNPVDYDKFTGLVKEGFGQDVNEIARNKHIFAGAAQNLQKTFDTHAGEPIDESNNPLAIKAMNVIFKPFADTNIGEINDKTGDKVISKKFSNILPVECGAPTPDDPTGTRYVLGMQTTYKRPDGSIYTDKPSPMTDLRSVNSDVDPNAKTFTRQQLFSLINGKTAMVDAIATSPEIQDHLNRMVDEGDVRKDKEKSNKFTSVKEKDNMGAESETLVNPVSGDVINVKGGIATKGKIGQESSGDNSALSEWIKKAPINKTNVENKASPPTNTQPMVNSAIDTLSDQPKQAGLQSVQPIQQPSPNKPPPLESLTSPEDIFNRINPYLTNDDFDKINSAPAQQKTAELARIRDRIVRLGY